MGYTGRWTLIGRQWSAYREAPVALYQDPATGEVYAFCSKQCYRQWVVAEEDHAPDALSEKFGCWYCGKCVYPGGEEAWENPENRMV